MTGDSVRHSVRVGLIANPSSGKDIRRLVGHAATISNQQKVGILRRVLIGLAATPVDEVLMMPDTHRLAEKARHGLARQSQELPATSLLPMAVEGTAEDSMRAARLLRDAGVGCIVVLGGDGTVRVVAQGAEQVPLLAISTGTNNVLPSAVEGTIAGIAAGGVAGGIVALERVAFRHKYLQLLVNGRARDCALVDVGVLRGRFVAARAVWRASDLEMVVATRGAPDSVGLSTILGVVQPVSSKERYGLALFMGGEDGRRFLVPLAPGLLANVDVGRVQRLEEGQSVEMMATHPVVCALDGEREFALRESDHLRITLRRDGPWLVDVAKTLAAMREAGFFES